MLDTLIFGYCYYYFIVKHGLSLFSPWIIYNIIFQSNKLIYLARELGKMGREEFFEWWNLKRGKKNSSRNSDSNELSTSWLQLVSRVSLYIFQPLATCLRNHATIKFVYECIRSACTALCDSHFRSTCKSRIQRTVSFLHRQVLIHSSIIFETFERTFFSFLFSLFSL